MSILTSDKAEMGYSGLPNDGTAGYSGYSGYSAPIFTKVAYVEDATAETILIQLNTLISYLKNANLISNIPSESES